jgi:PAS domain S-box-containing protein
MTTPQRESNELFRLLVEGVKDYAIFMLDPEGKVASWNPGAERIKGYRAEEILGRHFSVFYPSEATEAGWPDRELQLAQEEGRFEDEGWRLRKDGSQFWANVVITPLYDPENRLRGFAKVTQDLTERRRIAALEAAERYMNEFLAMLGHELRNPLAPIRNAVGALRAGGLSPIVREWCATVIDRQVVHMSRLVDDLLDVSRIATGKISFQKEKMDFTRVVASAVDSSRALIDAHQHTMEVELPEEPLYVEGDVTRISQIVLNLLSDAAKFTPNGGHIRVTLRSEGSQVVLGVKDTGIGMPATLLPKVFDLFMQGDHSEERRQGGLGIGLTLVRRLVTLHGGEVEAHSDGPGRGSELIVRLPLAVPDEEPDLVARLAESAMPDGSRRVLVIEDNRDSADAMAMLLELWGHEVRISLDGKSALDMARELRPEIVLLDIGMPGMNGYEVARQFRETAGLEDAKLVAVTGYGQAEDRRRSAEAGFHAHLTKPVDPAEIRRLIATLPEPPEPPAAAS